MYSIPRRWQLRALRDYYERYSKPRGKAWARTHLRTSTSQLRDLWNSGTKNPDQFYTEESVGAAYIGDLTAWHGSGTINAWFSAVLEATADTRCDILDYGAGIGTYSLMLAEQGHNVTACDISSTLRSHVAY